jgi:hypothetical protein
MIDSQTLGYWGMIGCAALATVLLVVERHLLRKQVKAQHELLQMYRKEKVVSDRLIDLLKASCLEYVTVLKSVGLIKDEEAQKQKLDG